MEIVQQSLPERRDLIKQLRHSKAELYQHQMFFQDKVRTFPVYRVGIDFPCYRLRNGRTRDAQLEVIAVEGLPSDFFTADPDSELALKKQDEILREKIKEKGLLDHFKTVEQEQPLILDNDGYVINGNRRLCAMRKLLQDDDEEYDRFRHVEVIFLPPCKDKDIKELEGRLQVQPDIRADYSWTAEAMLYRDLRESNWGDEKIAELYNKRIADVRELIAMLEDAEFYLASRSKGGRYSALAKKEFAFRELQKGRRRCGDDEAKKQVLTSIAYLMLDDPDTAEGRMYESIPDAQKFLDQITGAIRDEFPMRSKASKRGDGLDILGGTPTDNLGGIVQVLGDGSNAPKLRDIVRNTIEEMRNQERERRDATFCLRQVQQANTKLQSALSALDEEAETNGMDLALASIEQTVSSIRDWLKNANDQN